MVAAWVASGPARGSGSPTSLTVPVGQGGLVPWGSRCLSLPTQGCCGARGTLPAAGLRVLAMGA